MPRGKEGIYYAFRCDKETHPPFTPTAHQIATMNYFMKSKYKGLLLYHKLGSGKTCTSIMIADKMLKKKKVAKVFVLTPGSLRKGWITEYCQMCGYTPKYLKKYFTFITYNYNVGTRLPDFNNSLVIIDEVHNLINGVKNLSKTATAIYDGLSNANCRILALSGTPIFNYVYEWALLGNLLKPGTFPKIRRGGQLDTLAFMKKYFTVDSDDQTVSPKNPTRLKRDLEGVVSYFPGSGTEFYPSVEHMKPFTMVMPYNQEFNYWVKNDQENKLSRPPAKYLMKTDPKKYDLLRRLYIMARKNILTRSASNFYYPEEYKSKKDALVKNGGWVDKDVFQGQRLPREFSAKFTVFLFNILLHNKQKHVMFTFFKEKAGVNLANAMLSMCGIPSAIFSGDLDDRERSNLLKKFNDRSNRYGDKIRVLLVTEAGAEGITILEARHMHILESSPRESKIQQAIGRIVRYKSHYTLPKEEQKVQIWRYWSVSSVEPITIKAKILTPDGETEYIDKVIPGSSQTIDEILYLRGQKTLMEVGSFLKLLQEVSVTPYEK